MAADTNVVVLVGRATRPPELRHTGGGTSVLNVRLAFSSRVKGQDGSWGDKSNYVDVTIFGSRADALADLVGKGTRIGVTGRLDWREWETDGVRRQSLSVVAQDVQLLDPRGDQPSAASDMPAASTATLGGGGGSVLDSDIPFAPVL